MTSGPRSPTRSFVSPLERRAGRAQPVPVMGHALDNRVVRLLFQGEYVKIAGLVPAGIDHHARQVAAAGYDSELTRHFLASSASVRAATPS